MNQAGGAGNYWRAVFLAAGLVFLGIIIGYGFHSAQSSAPPVVLPSATPAQAPAAPIAKGLHISPDGRLLAFTAVYAQSHLSSRFVLDLATHSYSAVEAPPGWQDFVDQWSNDGRDLLFEREKIPQPVEEGTAGLYRTGVAPGGPKNLPPRMSGDQLLTGGIAPGGEQVTAGFWAPGSSLAVKTRGEVKSLYEVSEGKPKFIDRAITYYQNRAVVENGRLVYYVVKNISQADRRAALFRVDNGHAMQIGPAESGLVWAYLSEDVRKLVICRQAANGTDWQWALYSVTPRAVQKVSQSVVPADVIAVYWSPDQKHILGACGNGLWKIDLPSLAAHHIGTRNDWNADDAAWLPNSREVIVAADGRLWRVDTSSGTATQLWKFPDVYWK